MKKKCLECVVLLLFIFALTHGIIQNTQPLKETKEVQTEYEEKTSQVTEQSQETEPEVQDLENQILRTASGKFFQKYPVDEAFMGWIETASDVYKRQCIHSWKTEIRTRICGIGLPETVCMFCGLCIAGSNSICRIRMRM